MRTGMIVAVIVVLSLGAMVLGCHRSAANTTPSPTQVADQAGAPPGNAPAPGPASPPAGGTSAATPAGGPEEKPKASLNLPTFTVRQGSQEFDLAGASQVTILNKFGTVHVKAGGPKVAVQETIYARGKDKPDATARAKGFQLTSKRDPKEGLQLTFEGDAKNVDVGTGLVVSMPPTVKVLVRVSDGDVRVEDFAAPVTVDGSAGAVSVGKVKGKVGVSTAAGNITVAGATDGLEAQTSSGNLKLTDANGKVTARTMSGDIKLQVGRSEKILATTMSGAINVTVTSPFSGDLQSSSSSGDIRVAIPANSDCKVTTATGSGPTKCTLPLKDVKRNGPNYDAGHLGSGKGAVRIMNDTGAIELVPTT